MHFWSTPVKTRPFIHCAQYVSGFLRTLLLSTKYATISRYYSHSIQSGLVCFVARRGETRRRMSTLQSEVQIAIRPRPTLARLVCSPQLPRLRHRNCGYKCPRYGEDLHDLMGLRAHESCFLMQHIANDHPKVRCCGSLLNESDLDMHYLTSRNHPVCSRCNVGFPTEQEYAEVGGQGVASDLSTH